jgi:ribonuclease HI
MVWTDGSCYTGDRIGSYAWVRVDENDEEVTGGSWESDTTISRMELTGVIDALGHILVHFGPSVVLVYSDSEYVVKGITDRSRKRNANKDLWCELDEYVDDNELVIFEHVKGHDGDHYNEMCDKIAHDLRIEGQSITVMDDVPDDSDIQRKFQQFHDQNPHVYRDLVRLAREAKKMNRKRIGIEMLYGHLRWDHMMTTEDPESNYKLNDHYTSRYARKIMKENPDLNEIFQVRGLKS